MSGFIGFLRRLLRSTRLRKLIIKRLLRIQNDVGALFFVETRAFLSI